MLLTLQQVGNVKYTGWLLQVPCSADRKIIDQLQAQAKRMEDELCAWQQMVRRERECFYELNYFTTLQLLNLRREFGRLKNSGPSAVVAPEMLALLQSISTQVTPKVVSDIVVKVGQSELDSAQAANPANSFATCIDVAMSEASNCRPSSSKRHEDKKSGPPLDHGFSEKQKEIMANICSRLDCSKKLVLKAFEQCQGSHCNQFDYESWCVENMEVYNFLDDNDTDEDDESDQSEQELLDDQQEFKYLQGIWT